MSVMPCEAMSRLQLTLQPNVLMQAKATRDANLQIRMSGVTSTSTVGAKNCPPLGYCTTCPPVKTCTSPELCQAAWTNGVLFTSWHAHVVKKPANMVVFTVCANTL